MKNKSIAVPAVALGVGALALVAALVLAFVPFSKSGASAPTEAFRAQQDLDELAFKLAQSPGAKYSGTLSYELDGSGSNNKRDIKFENLIVTTSNNAEGNVTINETQADYRQIGNETFLSAPKDFWSKLLPSNAELDLEPTNNKWTNPRGSGLINLGYVFSPRLFAGRIANTETATPPQLGAPLSAPNKGLPDERYLPTSDPEIVTLADNKLKVGDTEITYDKNSKTITHAKGVFDQGGTKVNFDTSISLLGDGDIDRVFSGARSIAGELTSVPAPGIALSATKPTTRQTGECTVAACGYDVTVNAGTKSSDTPPGHVNFGVTVQYQIDSRPTGSVGGTCTLVLGPTFNTTRTGRCTARNLPAGSKQIRAVPTAKYLPFVDRDSSSINKFIDDNEKASKRKITMVRTGFKKKTAADYGFQQTALPSSYAVKQGDYLFDGTAPSGAFMVTFAPGYAEHVSSSGTFDTSWEGLEVLKTQAQAQVKAAGDGNEVVYWTSEESTKRALDALVSSLNLSDKITVYYEKADS